MHRVFGIILGMKKETRELAGMFGAALVVVIALALAYRVVVRLWPPAETQHQTLAQFLEEAQRASCARMLVKPAANWSEAEVKLEPEIYAWLKEQDNEILPWEWTDEARRKDQKGYAKCWHRIWKEQKAACERMLAGEQKESKRLDRELLILTTVYAHRTNQIARLSALAATNAFPCQVSVERLEKGRLWGWNKHVEVVECKAAAEIAAATNSICSHETAAAADEAGRVAAMTASLALAKEKSILYENLSGICDKCSRIVEDDSLPEHNEFLLNSLVEVLKGAKR